MNIKLGRPIWRSNDNLVLTQLFRRCQNHETRVAGHFVELNHANPMSHNTLLAIIVLAKLFTMCSSWYNFIIVEGSPECGPYFQKIVFPMDPIMAYPTEGYLEPVAQISPQEYSSPWSIIENALRACSACLYSALEHKWPQSTKIDENQKCTMTQMDCKQTKQKLTHLSKATNN